MYNLTYFWVTLYVEIWWADWIGFEPGKLARSRKNKVLFQIVSTHCNINQIKLFCSLGFRANFRSKVRFSQTFFVKCSFFSGIENELGLKGPMPKDCPEKWFSSSSFTRNKTSLVDLQTTMLGKMVSGRWLLEPQPLFLFPDTISVWPLSYYMMSSGVPW